MNYKNYLQQNQNWPQQGRALMAQYDDETIVVYQAYRASIAHYALTHQKFGGDFSFKRMSWIKPNFLWMMYRSGWAQKEGQEYVLGIRLRREFFDEILALAVASTFAQSEAADQATWRAQMNQALVVRQWDPDHNPLGANLPRKAIQLGLRGEILRRYAEEEIVEIIDVTPFVQAQHVNAQGDFSQLITPEEQLYPMKGVK